MNTVSQTDNFRFNFLLALQLSTAFRWVWWLKTWFRLRRKKTKRTVLHQLQFWETNRLPFLDETSTLWNENWKCSLLCLKIFFNKYFSEGILLRIKIKYLHYSMTSRTNQSDLCDTKAVLVFITPILKVAAIFCIEKKWDATAEEKLKVFVKTITGFLFERQKLLSSV